MDKADRLKKLAGIAEMCRSCSLASGRKKLVFSDGNPEAPILLVGEAPGKEEDESGVPFVGRCGRLLRDMLRAIGRDPVKDCYICNVVKCRPPLNRAPDQNEINVCSKFLRKQIEIVAPRVIVLLGKTAVKGTIPDYADAPLDVLRDRTKTLGAVDHLGTPVVVTFHPSALLRDKYRRPKASEDFKFLQSVINSYYGDGGNGRAVGNVPAEGLPVEDGNRVHGRKGGGAQGAPCGLPSLFSED